MIRIFEAFAGVGAQKMALRNIDIEHESVGIAEVNEPAILSYAAIHSDGQLPCPSLTLRGHGLLYSKSSTNVFQLLDSKLYKVCANQLSKQ